MAEYLTVDLKGRIEGGSSIEFLRAEMNRSMATPFALIRYAVDGVEPKNGLRIDLDKMAIFDRLGDPEKDAVIERAAPEIAHILGLVAGVRDTMVFSPEYPLGPDSFIQQINDLHHFDHFSAEEIAEIFDFPVDEVLRVTQLYRPIGRSRDATSPR